MSQRKIVEVQLIELSPSSPALSSLSPEADRDTLQKQKGTNSRRGRRSLAAGLKAGLKGGYLEAGRGALFLGPGPGETTQPGDHQGEKKKQRSLSRYNIPKSPKKKRQPQARGPRTKCIDRGGVFLLEKQVHAGEDMENTRRGGSKRERERDRDRERDGKDKMTW